MVGRVRKAFVAMKAGERLSHAAAWKKTQTAVNSVTAILALLVTFLPEQYNIATDDITVVAGIVVSIVTLFNTYVTTATSRKVGFPPETKGE
jgi:hypothetical protein